MANHLIFLYDIEYPPFANPRGRKEQLEDAFKEQAIRANGLCFLMSALAGMWRTRGIVYRQDEDVTLADRDKVEAWLRKQPVRCTVRLGDLEVEAAGIEYFRPVVERVFEVDNLTS